jgi:ribonuclease P protein component
VRSTLPKSAILSGHNAFGDVLQHGLVVPGRWTRCYVQLAVGEGAYPEFGTPVRIGFAVPKKIASSAVLRNRIRRLMRETVRMEKEQLWDGLREHRRTATLVLMLRRHDPAVLKKLTLHDIAAEWHSMVPKIISLC